MSLTREQQKEIVIIIDTWYSDWKHKMTDNHVPHRLGFAKEQLKKRVCE